MKKKYYLFILLLSSITITAQNLVFEQTFINAKNIQAYDNYIENVFSKTHQQRLDAGIIIGWDVWKVLDNPAENFTHMLTTVYDVEMQGKIDDFKWERPENVSQRDMQLRGKDLSEIREIVAVVKYMV